LLLFTKPNDNQLNIGLTIDTVLNAYVTLLPFLALTLQLNGRSNHWYEKEEGHVYSPE